MASSHIAISLHVVLLLGAVAPSSPAISDKTEKWTEVTTPHFIIMSDDGEKMARQVANQFEQIRELFSTILNSRIRIDPGMPILIIAVKNEKLLSETIPEYWVRKGNVHPAGLFVPGPEKNYIALRTDVGGAVPYQNVYHEYVHLIVNLNFQHIPLWLNEGFADFFGNAVMTPGAGTFGRVDSSYLLLLSRTKLIPLGALFTVGPRSSYYNEANKANIFYAESWALVHYMMTDPDKKLGNPIGKYMFELQKGGDPIESARAVFGDLNLLQRELQSYVRRSDFHEFVVALSGPTVSVNYTVRTLSPAEATGRLGDFDLYRGQLDEARPKIEEAMRLDPMLAGPQESMGLLLFRQDKPFEAQTYFSRAVALNSTSALSNFFEGMMLLSADDDEKTISAAQQLLEKSVTLSPFLAPAWDQLAILYSRNPATLYKALTASRNAVNAMPGDQIYHLDLADILRAMGRYDEAEATVKAVEESEDESVLPRAERLIHQIANSGHGSNSFDSGNAAGVDPFARSVDSDLAAASAMDPGQPELKRRRIGKIEAVDCTKYPAVMVTFRESSAVTHLRIAGLSAIEVHVESASSSTDKLVCDELKGREGIILYQPVSDKAWDGEVVSIHLR